MAITGRSFLYKDMAPPDGTVLDGKADTPPSGGGPLSLPESHTFGICALLLQLLRGGRNCLTV
jgi:hypothetical protein